MPARRLRLRRSHVFTLMAVVFLVPASVHAQTGATSVTLTGAVSKTVSLSALANSISVDPGVADASVMSNGSTVQVTLSGRGAGSAVIRIPLLVRSNSGFKVSSAFESATSVLAQLAVTDVRATGAWVSPQAGKSLEITRDLDLRGVETNTPSASNLLDFSRPLLVLSGPRVSAGGTLDSPNNALQITLLIRLQSQSQRGWLAHLTFVGSPE